MMVSFIQSNFSGFGSGVVVPGTAQPQNRLRVYVNPTPNVVAPRKVLSTRSSRASSRAGSAHELRFMGG